MCFKAEVKLKKWSITCNNIKIKTIVFSNIIINFKMAGKRQKTIFSVLNKVNGHLYIQVSKEDAFN